MSTRLELRKGTPYQLTLEIEESISSAETELARRQR